MSAAALKTESDYKLYTDGRFVIKNYDQKRPFSNFLPGIAGLYGTPMWVFYVNRGQGVTSFGTKNKDNAILEFFPANKAYQTVTSLGFRTFIKSTNHPKDFFFYEPFREGMIFSEQTVDRSMEVSSHEFLIREVNKSLGLEITVLYFTVPGEPLAALARELTLKNISGREISLEVLDGLPSVNPYGMNEFFVKQMSRTIEAWMVVENLEPKKAPFFRLKVDATDRPEVVLIEEGNFCFSVMAERSGKTKILDPIVDPAKIFGSILDFSYPENFCEAPSFKVPTIQCVENKTPCAFSFASFRLPAGKEKKIQSFFGQASSVELLNRYLARAGRADYLGEKREENKKLIEGIKSRTLTITASVPYDLYCGQTYLDNSMRGGLPIHLGDKKEGALFYVYSRKHGDLERDYNRFLVDPTYFSQGDGNYRDVNQNRRNDVWFDPEVKDANIKTFLNLLQLDGFNPLVIKGVHFHLKLSKAPRKILARFFNGKERPLVEHYLNQPFSPGELYRFLEERVGMTRSRFAELLKELAPFISREEKAEHGEGFWTDHWTYNLDLIESYFAIFPEERERIIFQKKEFTFYDSEYRVNPRHRKYFFLKKAGAVRQYQAVLKDKEKALLLAKREKDLNLVRTRLGHGKVYKTTLFVKLLCLFINKFASLDAEGLGIEMEADKPSWYDALNGLPGLLGSSLPESFELKRLALFLIHSLEDLQPDLARTEMMPLELYTFIKKLSSLLERHFEDRSRKKNFVFWDATTAAKEKFRGETTWGLSGREKRISFMEIKNCLEHAREKIEMGLERAFDPKARLFPTYFETEVTRYRVLEENFARPAEFKQRPLPFFLEAPVHALKVEKDPARRREILKAVRESDLYDSKLGMYKVNAPLKSAPLEVGRARVFTPGWLENESVWLHMEYKWMLEVLKSGMTEEFFRDFQRCLIPFQLPERYGRSILENSSFIVSGAFPDASLHGGGFVARLSGSTAELLTMWLIMNVGKQPFLLGPDKKLLLRFEPHLPASLFVKEDTTRSVVTKDGEEQKIKIPKNALAFMFLGKTLVVYHNPKRLDTFGKLRVTVRKVVLKNLRGDVTEFKGDTVPSPYAGRVRDEFVPRIDIELG